MIRAALSIGLALATPSGTLDSPDLAASDTAAARQGESAPTGLLPPLGAIQALRRARIAAQAGEVDEARRLLERAARDYPDDLLPLLRLVRHHEQYGDGEALGTLRGRLTEQLQQRSLALTPAALRYLIEAEELNEPELRAVEARLLGELDAAATAPPGVQVERLELLELIYVRLDEPGRQREIVGRLLELEPTLARRHRALSLDRALERWSDALAGVRQMLAEPNPSIAFFDLELELLARAGELAELERRLSELRGQNRPGTVERLITVAWVLEDDGHSRLAARVWRRILELQPEHPMATRVLTHLHAGSAAQAEP